MDIHLYNTKSLNLPTDPINCVVNEKNLSFQILGITDDPIEVDFIVQFSDGVRFSAGSNPLNVLPWTTELNPGNAPTLTEQNYVREDFLVRRKYIKYLEPIRHYLEEFTLVMGSDWYQLTIKFKNEDLVVWAAYRSDDDFPYSVYFNADYQFSLKIENGVWQSTSVRVIDPRSINPEIVEKVTKELESRI